MSFRKDYIEMDKLIVDRWEGLVLFSKRFLINLIDRISYKYCVVGDVSPLR